MSERLDMKVVELRSIDRQLERIEVETKLLKEKKNELEIIILPALFAEEGVRGVELLDGGMAKLSTSAAGSLPKEPDKRALAIEWLVANGYGEFIENKVTASYNKAERDKALALYDLARRDNSAKVTLDEGLNHMTLGKLCKDRVVGGEEVPLELLGVTVLPRVKITKMGIVED
jgi:hypothetical protein